MYLYNVTIQANNKPLAMKCTITQVLLFHERSVFPFPLVQILNPYHAELQYVLLVYVCVGGGRGLFYVVVFVFVMLFLRSQGYTPFHLFPK